MEDIIGDFPLEEIAERYHYIDWLRISVMLVVFFFHNERLFDYEAWLIKNDHLFVSFSILTRFTSQWTMPLSFLVAGASSYFLMRSKNVTQYINARSKRLLIPYLFAILFIIPPQKCLIALYNAHFRGHTINYCLHYFSYNPPGLTVTCGF